MVRSIEFGVMAEDMSSRDGEMERWRCEYACASVSGAGEDSLEPSQESYHCRDESTVDKRCVLIRERARYGWLQQTGMVCDAMR